MDLFAAVQRQYNVVHFAVGKIDHIVVNQHSVGGQGKPEMLPALLFPAPCVGDQVLDRLPVHQRLPAEKVHLQIPTAPGMLDQEV